MGEIVKRNIALLGKWLWRYPLEQQTLWATLIRSKFGHNSNCLDADYFPSSSHRSMWKGISQSLPHFRPFTILCLGYGNKIRFWLDHGPSLKSQPLSIRFPRLLQLSPTRRDHLFICLLSLPRGSFVPSKPYQLRS